jgi:hypothetical protein
LSPGDSLGNIARPHRVEREKRRDERKKREGKGRERKGQKRKVLEELRTVLVSQVLLAYTCNLSYLGG